MYKQSEKSVSTSQPPADAARPPAYSAGQFMQKSPAPPPAPPRASLARERSRQRDLLRRQRRHEWAWVILAGGMISVFAFLVVAMFVVLRAPQSAQVAIPTANLMPTPVDARSEFIADGRRVGVDVLKLDDGSLIEIVPWDGKSRYTIIIAGLDRRDDQINERPRTDLLMLLSIDPQTESVGLLSIPRDLWVEIPGFEERDRINRAYFLGGTQLLQQTVSLNLGVRVHNYMLLDFHALMEIVDILGGIEVTIDYTIDDQDSPDLAYGYDPFYLPPGTHTLDGYDALRFSRTRHGNNDVRRTERQQQVLQGIRARALDSNLFELITRLPAIVSTLESNLQTGLSLTELVQLAVFAYDLDWEDITMRKMDFNYVQEYITEDEYQQQVLIPLVERLPNLLRATFGDNYS